MEATCKLSNQMMLCVVERTSSPACASLIPALLLHAQEWRARNATSREGSRGASAGQRARRRGRRAWHPARTRVRAFHQAHLQPRRLLCPHQRWSAIPHTPSAAKGCGVNYTRINDACLHTQEELSETCWKESWPDQLRGRGSGSL